MRALKKTAISLLLASSFVLPVASFAANNGNDGIVGPAAVNPPPPGKHKKIKAHGMPLKQFFQKLDLDPAQQKNVISILKDTRQSSQAEMKQLRQSRGQVRQLIMNDTYTPKKAQAILQKRSQFMDKVIENKVKAEARIYAVLTPAQKDKLKSHFEMLERLRAF
ncbi:heavy-metal resistance family protein [Piscirickettsia salmonis]|uniref:Signaling pathway modulator ZraP n=1 Tax=Piscirickettsia salmonis TaxID=1238 RepID=A0A9Q5YGG6_PISSA|nr:Spy/CpxP family protein refolding chaperone [Piscirickettsia salmonis]RNC78984.1 heavy-metal resistance family protein [Piscirickettsiaceae bacterium NZ-RLO2]ALA25542.1 heavy-metal resistance family protein [Piscirickettsia salmonis]APS43051.1 heavy-metal resistance family protein [Piscirickettsia salmonis]APS46399.1 heavy-metal resistance family protein [Piscirickettsia salmonis]APS50368.1 heavy-metal resistance family protein [Piscirickettsia salmonis]